MAGFQNVRGYFEKECFIALQAGGIAAADIAFDNFVETAAPADRSYAIVSLTFGQTVTDTIGCEGAENILGTLQCNIYTPKNKGSLAGETAALEVLKAWNTINKRGTDHGPLEVAACRGIEGPISLAPDKRPHHANVVSCTVFARA
jgi:hypothetical protein